MKRHGCKLWSHSLNECFKSHTAICVRFFSLNLFFWPKLKTKRIVDNELWWRLWAMKREKEKMVFHPTIRFNKIILGPEWYVCVYDCNAGQTVSISTHAIIAGIGSTLKYHANNHGYYINAIFISCAVAICNCLIVGILQQRMRCGSWEIGKIVLSITRLI